jgi:hypothetical protein
MSARANAEVCRHASHSPTLRVLRFHWTVRWINVIEQSGELLHPLHFFLHCFPFYLCLPHVFPCWLWPVFP